MDAEHQKNIHAATLGSLGGMKRREQLNAQERSAIARHAERARWHPAKPRQYENAPRRSPSASNRP